MKPQDSTSIINDAVSTTTDDGIEKFRLTQDFNALSGVKKVHTTIPVRKPLKQEFIRVREGDRWRLETPVIELKEEREHYLVESHLWSEIPDEITPKVFFTSINRQGVCFLYPVKLPGEDGRIDTWNQSAMEAIQRAMKNWVRVSSNMSLGGYDVFEATGIQQEPQWPDLDLESLIQIAFKGRIINSMDHPVIQRLKGLS